MKGHLDPATAAEFRAGLVTGHRERAIAAHLAVCAECASLTERLTRVSALLAAAPMPVMPDSVASRLDRALAEEIQKPIFSERHIPVPHGKRRISSVADVFKIRVLAPAAAGLALLGGAAYGLTLVSGSSTSSSPASSVAAGSGHAPVLNAPEGAAGASASGARRYANGSTSGGEASEGEASGSGSVIDVVISGVDYRSATLKQQVSDELAARSSRLAAPAPTPTVASASAKLAGCVRNVIGRSSLVLVESAHYNGEPATLIVLRQGGQTKAVVAGPTCDATVSDILAHVVLS